MHRVSFPATVITGYQHHRIKKRAREGSEEVEEGAVGGSIFTGEYITPLEPTVASPPMSMPSPLAVPSTPTPANTPVSTPAHSPLRMESSVRQKPPLIPAKKKEKRDEDAGVVLTHTASKLPKGRMSHDTKVKHLQSAKMLKYIYQNNKYDREVVKDRIKQGLKKKKLRPPKLLKVILL